MPKTLHPEDAVDLFSVSEAARALNVSSQTVRDWAESGKRTAGGQRIFQPAAVERRKSGLLRSREVSG